MFNLLLKKDLANEIIESVLKEENTSKENNNTHRIKNKNLNTTNPVSSIFFYHQKILDSLFLLLIKIC